MTKRRLMLPAVIFFMLATILISSWFKKSIIHSGKILTSAKKYYSQGNEELIIRNFFNDRRGGIFVDVGCYHYKNLSTTFYLEKYLGWSGIAIDALPEFAAEYKKCRPRTKFFNFIVTNHSGTLEPFYRLIDDLGRSSLDAKRMVMVAKRRKINEKYDVIHVPTITLNELLEKNGISKIDFLSMDIEGGEPVALAGFDIEKFRPELVCIEANAPLKIMDYFRRHNYEFIVKYLLYDHINWYFKPMAKK